jgi:hypothetical protein
VRIKLPVEVIDLSVTMDVKSRYIRFLAPGHRSLRSGAFSPDQVIDPVMAGIPLVFLSTGSAMIVNLILLLPAI